MPALQVVPKIVELLIYTIFLRVYETSTHYRQLMLYGFAIETYKNRLLTWQLTFCTPVASRVQPGAAIVWQYFT